MSYDYYSLTFCQQDDWAEEQMINEEQKMWENEKGPIDFFDAAIKVQERHMVDFLIGFIRNNEMERNRVFQGASQAKYERFESSVMKCFAKACNFYFGGNQ